MRNLIAVWDADVPEVIHIALEERSDYSEESKVHAASGGNELPREMNYPVLMLMLV